MLRLQGFSVGVGILLAIAYYYIIHNYANVNELDKVYINNDLLSISLSNIAFRANEGIIFIKTHKTASSSLIGILWRNLCIDKHEYTLHRCFLPPVNKSGKTWDLRKYHDYNYIMRQSFSLYDNISAPFDVWLHHVKYDDRLYDIIPSAQRIISIIRNPSNRFISAWHWYNLNETTNMSLPQFIHNVYHDMKGTGLLSKQLLSKFRYRTGLDATIEELIGLSKYHPSFEHKFNEFLKRLMTGKVILLIADRFDESVLILRQILSSHIRVQALNCSEAAANKCSNETLFHDPDFSDWFYFKQKVNSYDVDVSSNSSYSSNDTMTTTDMTISYNEYLTDLQPYDAKLYDIANKVLDRYIDTYESLCRGCNFTKDLTKYQAQLRQFVQVCNYVRNNATLPSHDRISDISRQCAFVDTDNHEAIQNAWTAKLLQNTSNYN